MKNIIMDDFDDDQHVIYNRFYSFILSRNNHFLFCIMEIFSMLGSRLYSKRSKEFVGAANLEQFQTKVNYIAIDHLLNVPF